MLRNGVKTVTELRPPSRIGRRREVYNVGSNPRHGCQAVLKGKDATNDEIPNYALQHKEHQEGPRAADPSTLQL